MHAETHNVPSKVSHVGVPSHRLSTRHAVEGIRRPLGALIIGSKGEVSFCSDGVAQLAGYTAHELVGRNVRSLIPALPLSPATEGYNIAFGTFSSARRCLQSWELLKRDGTTVQVEGYFGMLKMDCGYVFCLELNHPGADTGSIMSSDTRPQQTVPVHYYLTKMKRKKK